MQKIIEAILNVLFLGFGHKLKGYKTIIFNLLSAGIVLIEFLTEKVHTLLCDSFNTGCESKFWLTLASVNTIVNMMLRYVTTTPAGEK